MTPFGATEEEPREEVEEEPSCPLPCLACGEWSRDWIHVLDAFDRLYLCAEQMEASVHVDPCPEHGGHVKIGPVMAQAAACRICGVDVVILTYPTGVVQEWDPEDNTLQRLGAGDA